MLTGTVTAVFPTKGFGFLRDRAGSDRFFHARDLATPIAELLVGTSVEFEHEPGLKGNGLRAKNLRVTSA